MDVALKLSPAIDRLNEAIGKAVYWLILVAVLVSAGNAIVRKVFDISSNAWLEMQWYLFGAVFLLCAAYTLLQQRARPHRHRHQPPVQARCATGSTCSATCFFLLPFAIMMHGRLSWPFFIALLPAATSSRSNAGGLPHWPAKLLIPVGFFLLFLQGVSELIKRIAFMRGLIPDPHGDEHGPRRGADGQRDARLTLDRGAEHDAFLIAEHGADHVRRR